MSGRPAVLVIAATDSSGGAGMTRDVRVLSELGVDALCAVTAVTAQSDATVVAVHHVPPEVIRAQIRAAFDTRTVAAVKIGMLGTRATVEAVAEALLDRLDPPLACANAQSNSMVEAHHAARTATTPAGRAMAPASAPPTQRIPLVIDPVLVSSSGGILLDEDGRAALTRMLFPTATLITPNVPEVAALLGEAVATDEPALLEQGRRLLALGSEAILLKGGHSAGQESVDLLISRDRVDRLVASRVAGSSRGTGCALASAIAAGLARGETLLKACAAAKHYVLGMFDTVSRVAP